jgi:hypothetical protein
VPFGAVHLVTFGQEAGQLAGGLERAVTAVQEEQRLTGSGDLVVGLAVGKVQVRHLRILAGVC